MHFYIFGQIIVDAPRYRHRLLVTCTQHYPRVVSFIYVELQIAASLEITSEGVWFYSL